MDGQALELEDDTFDLAGSQFGVMLFPDLETGLSELVRVTKPGGQVVLITMGPPAKIEVLSTAIFEAARVEPVNYGAAMAEGVAIILLALPLLYLYRRFVARSERFQTVSGMLAALAPMLKGRNRLWPEAAPVERRADTRSR